MPPLAEAFVRLRADTSGLRRDTDREFRGAGEGAGRSFQQGLNRNGGLLGNAGQSLSTSLRGLNLNAAGAGAGRSFLQGFNNAGLNGLGDGLRNGFNGLDLSGQGAGAGQSFGNGFLRGADGRLRDARGRFASTLNANLGPEGEGAGRSFGDGLTRGADGRLRDARGRFARTLADGPPLRTPPVDVPPIRVPPINDPPPVRVEVNVDVDRAKTALMGLGMDILNLAKIPVGATLGVGLAGLATAAVAAGAGLGAMAAVAVPSINRVKEALAAQEKAQDDEGASAAASLARSNAIAGARAALASAIRNQAEAHARALEQVSNAERSVADAQRSARDAQLDINRARQDAKRDLEDLKNQVISTQLALRRAQLDSQQAQADATDAQKEYDKVRSNPKATKDEIEAARRRAESAKLSAEEAKQRLAEQQLALKRLKEEQQDADKKGVEGSDQVKSAREKLAEANRRLADSERALAKAKQDVGRTDRQSAESIASARRGLASAMAAGAAGTDAFAKAMAKLSPEERKLFDDTKNLKDTWEDWQKSMQPKVLPLVSQGIGILRGQIPALTPLVNNAASAMGGLLDRVAAGAKSSEFKAFRDQLTALVPNALSTLGNVGIDIATGIGRIFQAFLPYAPAALSFLRQGSQAFAEWTKGLSDAGTGQGGGFQALIQYVRDNGPLVLQTLKDVAAAFIQVGGALAPLAAGGGVGALSTIGLLARAISGFSPGTIQALAVAFVAVRVALAGYKVAQTAAEGVQFVNAAFRAGSAGPLWARALTGVWNGLKNVTTAAKNGVVSLYNWARAQAASAAATVRAKAVAAGSWIADQARAVGAWAAALFNQARAATASALATARAKAVAAGTWLADQARAAGALALSLASTARAATLAALASARQAIATAASTTASIAANVATKAWAAGQWLLNAALSANPIGLVVVAIAGLVAGLVLAYKNVGWFKSAVDATFSFLKDAVLTTIGFVRDNWKAIISVILGPLGIVISLVATYWDQIRAVFVAAWAQIQPVLAALGNFVTGTLAPAILGFWQNVIAPAFSAIGMIISAAWTGVIQPVLQAVWTFVSATLGPIFSWLWRNIVQPAFAGIGQIIATGWAVIRPILNALWSFISVTLGPIFTWLWTKIVQPIWGYISKTISDGWNLLIKPALTAIWNYITTYLGPIFTTLWKTYVQPMWKNITDIITGGWNNFIKPALENLAKAAGAIGGAFDAGANAIGKAWDKIKGYAATPINFVINKVYNDGIVGMWNTIMGWLKIDGLKLGKIEGIKGYASGGVLDPRPVSPMMTNGPMAIVGEGRRQYPEFVIPTDPKYRGRARGMMNAAAGRMGMQMLAPGGVLGWGDDLWGKVKDIAGGVTDLAGDALDLITDPKKVWDKLVGKLPKANFPGPYGQAVNAIPPRILDEIWKLGEKVFKAFGDGYGGQNGDVVNAALKYIGKGDDRGVDNNNMFTRRYGWPSGTEWCALFVSAAIEDAKAGKRYPGTPSAAVATFNARMKHVPVGEGKPGDLATYGSSDHINMIIKKAAGGYDTVGGNQGPVVNRYVRGGQATVLRPMAAGGTLSEVMSQRAWDPNDRKDPGTRALRDFALYDQGGWLQPVNKTRSPEPVFTEGQWSILAALVQRGAQDRGQLFGDVIVQEPADVDMLMARAEFAARSRSFD